jgi:hypothetical protein
VRDFLLNIPPGSKHRKSPLAEEAKLPQLLGGVELVAQAQTQLLADRLNQRSSKRLCERVGWVLRTRDPDGLNRATASMPPICARTQTRSRCTITTMSMPSKRAKSPTLRQSSTSWPPRRVLTNAIRTMPSVRARDQAPPRLTITTTVMLPNRA